MQHKYEVLRLLKEISTGKRRLYGIGICCLLLRNLGHSNDINIFLTKAIQEWPEATGGHGYIIRHPTLTPCEAYHQFSNNHWLMNGRSPYGMERRKLAKYLYTKLKETDEF
jgi:hypothetical protein